MAINSKIASRTQPVLIVFIHGLVTSALIAFACVAYVADLPPEGLIRPLCILQSVLLIWMAWSWFCVAGTLFDLYFLFVLGTAAFHSGQVLLECLQLNTAGFLYGWFAPEVSVKALFLVLLSLALLHLGALGGRLQSKLRDATRNTSVATATAYTRRLGWLLLAVSLIPAVLLLKDEMSAVMSGGYFYAMFARQAPTGFGAIQRVLASFLVPSLLLLLAGSGRNWKVVTLATAIMAAYCALYLFIGSRTVAAVSLGAYAWLWHRTIRPLAAGVVLAVGLIALLAIFPLVSLIRNEPGESRFSWDYVFTRWSSMDRPALEGLSETGGSLVTVAYTVDLVPEFRQYDLGMSYAMALLTVFPNFFWELHPGVAYGTPSNWMMETVDPQTASSGGGLGYSFIAEAYYNFGWCGPLLIALLGFILGRLAAWVAFSADPARLVMVANLLPPLLWYVRNEASGAVRSIVWYALIPYLLVILASRAKVPLTGQSTARVRLYMAPRSGSRLA